jgi:glycosyltransferase involved in cell wall biosynthesis
METEDMQKPKVLYIHANNDEVGGADYCLFKMVHAVHYSDWPCLVVLRRETNVCHLYRANNIPIIILPIVRLQKDARKWLTYFFSAPRTIWMLYKLIKTENIGIVHTNDLLDFLGNIASRLAKVPSCQHIRMILRRPKILIYALRWISMNFNSRILCVSEAVRNSLFPDSSRRVQVLYDWLDLQLVGHNSSSSSIREELRLSEETKLVGCVGRLEHWKGQHLFIQAADKILRKHSNVHFLVIGGLTTGKETYLGELTKLRDMSISPDHIHFLGQRNDVASIMGQLDVMVHSSVEPDPLPGVVMEAMSCGTLVVGPNSGGVPEEIDDGKSGFLYAAGNCDDMAEKITMALRSNKELFQKNACAAANTKFSRAPNLEKLFKIYEESRSNA